ncbi:MAG: sce7726 family protein [Acholeplasmataceae bacterium]|nr:sce7726 family protein [Acholeplasmataceae bacterium]
MNNYNIQSLKYYFGEAQLKRKTISWIESYSPRFSDEKLSFLFSKCFEESPSLFEINGNSKEALESLMIAYYHNEAFVKAFFISELKKQKAVSFFELPIKNSRVDICSINGHSIAYEIKTMYDSTKRLVKQLNDYLTAFEFVYVICPDERVEEISQLLPDCVGIYTYDDLAFAPKFMVAREAKISSLLDRHAQIEVMRKKEKPKNISLLSDDKINALFKTILKNRFKNRWDWFCTNYKQFNKLDYQYHFNNY